MAYVHFTTRTNIYLPLMAGCQISCSTVVILTVRDRDGKEGGRVREGGFVIKVKMSFFNVSPGQNAKILNVSI